MGWIVSAIGWFTNPGFMPYVRCYLDDPHLVWTMLVTDVLIGLAFVVISVTLIGLVQRLRIPFSPVVLCFGVFLGACGLTHFMEVWTLWHPDYWAAAVLKTTTAVAAVGTSAYLLRVRRSIITVAQAAKLSEQRRLDLEVLTKQLDQLVAERTAQLQATTDQFQLIADSFPALVAYVDRERRYRFVNAAYQHWWGFPRADILGRSVSEVLGAEVYASVAAHLDAALAGEQVTFEASLPLRLGMRHVQITYVPDTTPTGVVKGLVVLVTDLTERQHAEAQRQQTQAQLEAAIQAMTDGIMVFNMSGEPVLINQAEAQIIGFANTDEMQRNLSWFAQLYELATLDGRPVPLEEWPISCVLRGESVTGVQLRAHRTDLGRDWFLEFSGEPVRNQRGQQFLGVVITRDITDLKKAEQALRESEEKFRTLANVIPQLAWMTDEKGWIFWYNQRWYDYTGTTFEEMQGWGWMKVHHPDHLDRVVKRFKQHLELGTAWEDTFPLRRHTGEWRWFLSRAVPVRDDSGRVVRWFGSNTDITEQLATQRALEEAVRSRDEFLSVASHELKTPLTSLRLQVQLFARWLTTGNPRASEPERIARLVEQAEKQTARLSRLVDDMLDITRIQTGKLSIQPKPTSLREIVAEVIERLRPSMHAAGTPPTLICTDPVEGVWDRFRLEQVVTNLLTNAMRYGEGKPVEVRVDSRGELARLSVTDHGLGVRQEDQGRIFQQFERAVSADEVSGLGLGLFISQKIVASHGGKMWVESGGLGQGATFVVELPRQPPA